MSQRDATNGYIATMCVCASIIRTTRSTNGYIPDYRSEVRTPVRTQHKYNLDIRILWVLSPKPADYTVVEYRTKEKMI